MAWRRPSLQAACYGFSDFHWPEVCVVCMVLCVVPICEAFNERCPQPDVVDRFSRLSRQNSQCDSQLSQVLCISTCLEKATMPQKGITFRMACHFACRICGFQRGRFEGFAGLQIERVVRRGKVRGSEVWTALMFKSEFLFKPARPCSIGHRAIAIN